MTVPKYIQDLMSRARYDYNTEGPKYAVGYTIKIDKRTCYVKAKTHQDEIEKLANWVRRHGGKIVVHEVPYYTRIDWQPAIVTIYDPIMQHLEKYIPSKKIQS